MQEFKFGNDVCLFLIISILPIILEKGRNYFQINILFLYRADFLFIKSLSSKIPKNYIKMKTSIKLLKIIIIKLLNY